MQLYREVCRLSLNNVQRAQVAQVVGDLPKKLELYREVLNRFMAEGQPKQRADWTVERFQKAEQLMVKQITAAAGSRSVFSPESLREHVLKCRQLLMQLAQWRSAQNKDALCDAMTGSVEQLMAIEQDMADRTAIDTRQLEEQLSELETRIGDAMLAIASVDQLVAARAEAQRALKPARDQMDTATYNASLERLVLRQLRQQFGVPRLSLYA